VSEVEHALRDLTPDALGGLATRIGSQIRAMESQRRMARGRIIQSLIAASAHKDATVGALHKLQETGQARAAAAHRNATAYRRSHEALVASLARFLPAGWREEASFLFREAGAMATATTSSAADAFASASATSSAGGSGYDATTVSARFAPQPAARAAAPSAHSAPAPQPPAPAPAAPPASFVRSLFQSPEHALQSRYGIPDPTVMGSDAAGDLAATPASVAPRTPGTGFTLPQPPASSVKTPGVADGATHTPSFAVTGGMYRFGGGGVGSSGAALLPSRHGNVVEGAAAGLYGSTGAVGQIIAASASAVKAALAARGLPAATPVYGGGM